jgi:hypothetical protein
MGSVMLGPATGVGAMPFGYCALQILFKLSNTRGTCHRMQIVMCRAPISAAHCAATISRINAMFL